MDPPSDVGGPCHQMWVDPTLGCALKPHLGGGGTICRWILRADVGQSYNPGGKEIALQGRGGGGTKASEPPLAPPWLPCRDPFLATDRPWVTGGGGGGSGVPQHMT